MGLLDYFEAPSEPHSYLLQENIIPPLRGRLGGVQILKKEKVSKKKKILGRLAFHETTRLF